MADGAKLTVKGKDALFAKLQKLVPGIGKAMGEANRQTADEMAALARSFAPVKTGKLRSSIRVEPGPRPGSYRVLAGGPSTTRYGYDYAAAMEFGTSAHTNAGVFKGSENPGVHRQPFFFVALRLVRKPMRSRAARALNKAIKAVSGQ